MTTLVVIAAACGGSSRSADQSEATAASHAAAIGTIEARAAAIAPARADQAAGAVATASASGAIRLPDGNDAFDTAGSIFIGLTRTTDDLIAHSSSTDAWTDRLQANLQGYEALAEAWRFVQAPACAQSQYAGLRYAYDTYASGAARVLQALAAGTPPDRTTAIDQPPLLRSSRTGDVQFDEVEAFAFGQVGKKEPDPDDVAALVRSLGLFGADDADLVQIFNSYYEGGGIATPRPAC